MIYYHGTSKEIADKVRKNGLNPSNSKYQGRIYLTTNHQEASKYAKIASSGRHGVVFQVHSDHIHPEHIYSKNGGIIEYKGTIMPEHLKEDTNVGAIAGSGDARLQADQREPAFNINNKKKFKFRRNKLTTNLDELSRGTLARYIRKAGVNRVNLADKLARSEEQMNAAHNLNPYQKIDHDKMASEIDDRRKDKHKSDNRYYGIRKALNRLAKEDVQLDELSRKRKNKGEYYHDYDKEIEGYGVFHTDKFNGKALASYASEVEAKEHAKKLNKNLKESAFELLEAISNKAPGDFYNIFEDVILTNVDDIIEDNLFEIMNEDQLDELGGKTLIPYINRAASDIENKAYYHGVNHGRGSYVAYGYDEGLKMSADKTKEIEKRKKYLRKATAILAKKDGMR